MEAEAFPTPHRPLVIYQVSDEETNKNSDLNGKKFTVSLAEINKDTNP